MAILMRRLVTLMLALLLSTALRAGAQGDFVALCYHEVTGDDPQPYSSTAISARELAAHFAWLQANGYHPVSIDAILASRHGGAPLPDHAVLLSFDDGLANVYSRAYPLLKLFHYPAVVAPVGAWMDLRPGDTEEYGSSKLSPADFVTWDQLKEMQQSGLVEVATHLYQQHLGIVANPQGNREPAVTARLYAGGMYEGDASYERRMRDDLIKARDQIDVHLGRPPRVVVWPYGRSNRVAQDMAASLGMPIGLLLETDVETGPQSLLTIRRHLIQNPATLTHLAEIMRETWPPPPRRALGVDPTEWPAHDESRLSATLDQLLVIQPNMVFLPPVRSTASGQVALFPTSQLPVGPDVLNRIAWQIESRTGAAAYIDVPDVWLDNPGLLEDLARYVPFQGLRVKASPGSASAEALRRAAGRWRWPVHLVYRMASLPSPEVWNQLPEGDWVQLPANDAVLAGLPIAARGHVILVFDATASAHATARTMRSLEAKGFGDFAIDELPPRLDDEVRQAFSPRSEPLR
ncbi:poly-beta-1,6-N-acetyl-D-glucosamine N-deacetylase PgaB [Dyella silvae]|uniref:poly-beta-1,6-N-acetyl-D-glucosamine N-deacetylase PgaB n=1 Tax=Dyella silvae TaxID=2994424 RepID=UPI002263CC46|nr:poly-beta-1,6-N-acetyl-D-glucosamine N-deacetylase PgaB [Dyella silvae]